MPHDKNGKLLQAGDKVILRGTVKEVYTSEDYCNCAVVLEEKMPPDNTDTEIAAINTHQVEKAE